MNLPEITTQLTLKWGVQKKVKGYNPEDYFSADDFQDARGAYEQACMNITGEDQEWIALFSTGRMTSPDGWKGPRIHLFHDNRVNNAPVSAALAGLFNSLESDWF